MEGLRSSRAVTRAPVAEPRLYVCKEGFIKENDAEIPCEQ